MTLFLEGVPEFHTSGTYGGYQLSIGARSRILLNAPEIGNWPKIGPAVPELAPREHAVVPETPIQAIFLSMCRYLKLKFARCASVVFELAVGVNGFFYQFSKNMMRVSISFYFCKKEYVINGKIKLSSGPRNKEFFNFGKIA